MKTVPTSFFGGFLAGSAGLLALFAVAFFLNLGVATKLTTWAGGVNEKKETWARKSHPPRILVAGGSASLFGISAREMEALTGLRSLNLASHAGLGTRVLLDFVGRFALPGDVILLGLEYELYQSGYFNRESLNENNIDYVLARSPDLLQKLRAPELAWFFLLTPDKRLRRGLENRFFRGNGRGGNAIYSADSIDSWGDQVLDPRVKGKPVSEIPNRSILASGLCPEPDGFALLREFISDCAAKKIKILAAYPNLMDRPKYRTDLARHTAERIREFYRAQGVEMAGSYEQVLLPPDDFFDTEYHLRTEPAVRRTRLLATQVLSWLKQTRAGSSPGV